MCYSEPQKCATGCSCQQARKTYEVRQGLSGKRLGTLDRGVVTDEIWVLLLDGSEKNAS